MWLADNKYGNKSGAIKLIIMYGSILFVDVVLESKQYIQIGDFMAW
jgi:hypothetical protein